METSASKVGSGEIQQDLRLNNSPSKLKTYGFAILIIVGIGGLVAAGFGLGAFGTQQGWWVAGSLSTLGQIDAIIMMAAGGGGGIAFLVVGIVGSVKNKGCIGKGLNELLIESRTPNLEEEPMVNETTLLVALLGK